MGGGQQLGTNMEFAHKGKRLGDPILQLLLYPHKDHILELEN